MDQRRGCCCGDGAELTCASRLDWRRCNSTVVAPGDPNATDARRAVDRFGFDDFNEPIAAAAIRITGTGRSYQTSDIPGALEFETVYEIDRVVGILYQYGRAPDATDVAQAFGSGRITVGPGVAFPADPLLFVAVFAVENGQTRSTTPTNPDAPWVDYDAALHFSTLPFGSGLNSTGLRVIQRTAFSGCTTFAETVLSGPFGTDRETYFENFVGSRFSAAGSSEYVRDSTTTAGDRFVTVSGNESSESIEFASRLGDLGPHWLGPSDYRICDTVTDGAEPPSGGIVDVGDPETGGFGPGQITGGDDSNAAAILAAMGADPLRGCRSCGDPGYAP